MKLFGGRVEMPLPHLAVVAEGDLPTGERWAVRAGGTAEDYYTLLETVHPDGRRDEGGMGGPPLYPGHNLNTYTGGDDRGPHPVLARTSVRVRWLRMELDSGEVRDLEPVGSDIELQAVAARGPLTRDPL
jgi:hypothetical protein